MSFPEFDMKVEGKAGVLKMLDPKLVDRAERNAVNATATGVAKFAGKEAAAVYNIKARRIKRTARGKKLIRVKRARAGQSEATIFFGSDAPGDRPNFRNFTPNRAMVNRPGGFKYKIKKSDGLEVLPGGFFADVKNNNRIVVQRSEGTRIGARGRPILKRDIEGDITSRTGPSTKQMIEDPIIFEKVKNEARTQFDSTFEAKLRDQLVKLRRRGIK